MSIKFSPTDFALWLLSAIEDPQYTSDSGVTAKSRAIELMEAAGLSNQKAKELLQEWLDTPQQENAIADEHSDLVQTMAAGANVLFNPYKK